LTPYARIISVEVMGAVKSGDGWVVVLIVLVLGTWLFLYVRHRMRDYVYGTYMPIPANEPFSEDEITRLLSEQGYAVVNGKQRIPIRIKVNEDHTLYSRLFIDYFAEKDGIYYTVKIARERKPMEVTGSSIRDRLLIYQLVYPQTSGVLYVELGQRKVNLIEFELNSDDTG
jgi:hypothetical protein